MIVMGCFVFSFIGVMYLGNVCIVLLVWLYLCVFGGWYLLCFEDFDIGWV